MAVVWCKPSVRWQPYALLPLPISVDCLIGLAVKESTLRAADPCSIPTFARGDFSRLSHTSDLKISTPGASHYWVSTGTGWCVVRIL